MPTTFGGEPQLKRHYF
ncbi:hypothetical protein [Staphylococcus aureus]